MKCINHSNSILYWRYQIKKLIFHYNLFLDEPIKIENILINDMDDIDNLIIIYEQIRCEYVSYLDTNFIKKPYKDMHKKRKDSP